MGTSRAFLYGIGVNDSTVPIREIQEEYRRWVHILNRCYGTLSKGSNPKPQLDSRWLVLSNFLEWLYSQPNWRDYELHKGIKEAGNVIYSPELCVMVHPTIRRAFSSRQSNKKNVLHGVTTIKRAIENGNRAYCAQGRDCNGKNVFLGTFWTPEEAHRAWQKDKIEHLLECLSLTENEHVVNRVNREIKRIKEDIKHNRITNW